MKRAAAAFQSLILGVVTLPLVGCLERKEKVVVDPDGTTHLEVIVSAPDAKMLTPAVTPAEAAGWKVERTTVQDAQGKPSRHVVTAIRTVAAGQALPSTDAAPSDLDADLSLEHPTTVTVEKRPDGTWYHFRRVYPARAFAWYRALEDQPQREAIEGTLKKPKAQITSDEWRSGIRFMAGIEARRKVATARRVALALTPDLAQDRWLKASAAAMACVDKLDYDLLVKILAASDGGNDGQSLVRETERMNAAIDEQIRKALTENGGCTAEQLAEFDREYAQLTRRVKLTADMDGNTYSVTLTLPGKVMGSNADETLDNTLVWKFKGNAVFDRDIELLASSRVAASQADK